MDIESIENSNSQKEQNVSRKRTKERRKPSWMSDFVCQVNFIHKNASEREVKTYYTHKTFPYISPSYFSPDYLNYIGNLTYIKEPSNCIEAKGNPAWVRAMDEEIHALEKKTWEICKLPKNKKPIGLQMGL